MHESDYRFTLFFHQFVFKLITFKNNNLPPYIYIHLFRDIYISLVIYYQITNLNIRNLYDLRQLTVVIYMICDSKCLEIASFFVR